MRAVTPGALFAILGNLGLFMIYIVSWFTAYKADMFWRADFTCFYTGASIIWSGRGAELYELAVQKEFQSQILQSYIQPNSLVLGYISPPHMALLLSPLAAFPLSSAFVIWTLVQLVMLGWFIKKLLDYTKLWTTTERLLSLAICLGLHFTLLTFMLGALSLIMLICMMKFYEHFKVRNDGPSGVWLAVGSLKPQNTLLLGAVLIGSRRWKTLAGAAVTTIVVLIATTLILGWRVWPSYFTTLIYHANLFDAIAVDPRSMYNLKGTLSLIFQQENLNWINVVSYASMAAGILVVIWMWGIVRRSGDQEIELPLAITTVLGLLLSPHLNPQDGLILIFPALLFYKYLRDHGLNKKIFAVVASVTPAIFLLSEFTIGGSLGFRVPALVMAGFLVWMVYYLNSGKPKALLAETES